MVIDHVNFHIEDNDLKFSNTWLWFNLECAREKFAKSWFDRFDAFYDG